MYSVPKLKSFSAAALDKAVEKLLAALKQEASAVKNEADWKTFRDRWMARKNGVLTEINDLWLKAAPKDAKREVGQRVNEIKAIVEEAVAKAEDCPAVAARAAIFGENCDLMLSTSPSPAFVVLSAPSIP